MDIQCVGGVYKGFTRACKGLHGLPGLPAFETFADAPHKYCATPT